jgi:hypothetical protein
MKTMKSQISIILIVLIIIIFIGVTLFLLSFAETISQREYMNLYVHNLLLSVMRTDTGYIGSDCKLVSDLIACAFFKPTFICGNYTCLELANQTIYDYMSEFELIKKNYRYLFTVTAPGYVPELEGEQIKLEFGDPELKGRIEKITANYYIEKVFGTTQYILKAQLIIAKK